MAVLSALPTENGESLFMKYLSNQSCREKGGACYFDYRGHFKLVRLPPIVR